MNKNASAYSLKNLAILILSLLCGLSSHCTLEAAHGSYFHYYCTVADERHFPLLMSLIGSIHKNDFDHLDEVAVFDVGLTQKQREFLETIEKTKVYAIEKVHPDLCTYFRTDPGSRTVRGWFAWKPVVLKQALDLFPYALYLDAGTLVLNSPDNLFKHIQQNGYFMIDIPPHSIEERITKPVIEKVLSKFSKKQQEFLMRTDTPMISAGFQGVSRDIYQRYILPMYKCASDLSLFEDDGSARLGFGAGRHDQTLFSIFAHVEKLHLNHLGWTSLRVDGKATPFHIHWNRAKVNRLTCIYQCRSDHAFFGDTTTAIHFRGK